MGIVVQKYGGSSVADLERLRAVASRVVATAAAGNRVIVVVSAMGRTTDDLLSLAKSVNQKPSRRELDMLLTVGERVSMALLSLAIGNLGREAISFTGSQSGIITDEQHSDARIIEVRPTRIEEELARGRIVIVAGFQGVSRAREVTTLGRGGSDTTAVALAAALGADYCEICSDVDGVYTGDPRVVDAPIRLESLGYQEMQELAESGAKVLCAQAVEWAKRAGITIHARATAAAPILDVHAIPESRGTRIEESAPARRRVVGVASEKRLVAVTATGADVAGVDSVNSVLRRFGIETKQVTLAAGVLSLLFSTTNVHNMDEVKRALLTESRGRIGVREGIGAVSIVGAGIGKDPGALGQLIALLRANAAQPAGLHSSSFRLTVLIPEDDVDRITRAAHATFVTASDT